MKREITGIVPDDTEEDIRHNANAIQPQDQIERRTIVHGLHRLEHVGRQQITQDRIALINTKKLAMLGITPARAKKGTYDASVVAAILCCGPSRQERLRREFTIEQNSE